jgi:hypothetical protein
MTSSNQGSALTNPYKPNAVPTTQTLVPIAFATTVTNPDERPSAKVRPIAKTTLGPGIKMITRDVIKNVIIAASVGMAQV